MNGKVIQTAVIPHQCDPGWTWTPIPEDSDLHISLPSGEAGTGDLYGIPPKPWEYPAGTVWECACGRAWVAYWHAPPPASVIGGHMAGGRRWRPERRRERRKRLGLRWWQREGKR